MPGAATYRVDVWRHDLVGRALLPPAVLRFVEALDVQLHGDQAHGRGRHGILHGVRMAQEPADALAIYVVQALLEALTVRSTAVAAFGSYIGVQRGRC
jgi:hypothetical protein